MQTIQETATLTSKGQLTLPKSIRQALGVDIGGKISFHLSEDGRVQVARAETCHEDPAISAFLALLAHDIESGQHIHDLPQELAHILLEQAKHGVNPDDPLNGDVAL